MSAQFALFDPPPSLTELSEPGNAHEAYQRFLMAEQGGDAALLAWAKAWARPVAEGLRDMHDLADRREEQHATEVRDLKDEARIDLEATKAEARELASDVAGDLRSIATDLRETANEATERARLLGLAANRLVARHREGSRL
jgi:hypothetical protein